MDAARRLTLGAIDEGQKPAVISAIVKRYLTEGMRSVVNDAMDVQAGAAISRGPRNILAAAYAAVPVGITVEGANILTRTLIIYGQGAIRCHPYVQKEMAAAAARDVAALDRAFFGHVGHVVGTAFRAFGLALTGGALAGSPAPGRVGPLFRTLARYSAAFALVSDAAMATLGGALKRKESLSGRLADALAWMYIESAALKRYLDDGQPPRDWPYVRWTAAHASHQIESALRGVLDNMPHRFAAAVLGFLIFPLGARRRPPADRLSASVARSLLTDAEARDRLTADIHLPAADEPGLGRLEAAYRKVVAAAPADRKIKDAARAGRLKHAEGCALFEDAVRQGVISEAERKQLCEAQAARQDVIQVDSFGFEAFPKLRR
jgi:acyl-CoA dehydrogenase